MYLSSKPVGDEFGDGPEAGGTRQTYDFTLSFTDGRALRMQGAFDNPDESARETRPGGTRPADHGGNHDLFRLTRARCSAVSQTQFRDALAKVMRGEEVNLGAAMLGPVGVQLPGGLLTRETVKDCRVRDSHVRVAMPGREPVIQPMGDIANLPMFLLLVHGFRRPRRR